MLQPVQAALVILHLFRTDWPILILETRELSQCVTPLEDSECTSAEFQVHLTCKMLHLSPFSNCVPHSCALNSELMKAEDSLG